MCCRLGMVEVKFLGTKIKDGGKKSFSEVFTPTGEQFYTFPKIFVLVDIFDNCDTCTSFVF